MSLCRTLALLKDTCDLRKYQPNKNSKKYGIGELRLPLPVQPVRDKRKIPAFVFYKKNNGYFKCARTCGGPRALPSSQCLPCPGKTEQSCHHFMSIQLASCTEWILPRPSAPVPFRSLPPLPTALLLRTPCRTNHSRIQAAGQAKAEPMRPVSPLCQTHL